MNIFITGMSGQLGLDVYAEVKRRGHNVSGCGRTVKYEKELSGYFTLDLTGHQNIYTCIDNVDAIIHCAAWTNVDAADKPENKNAVFYSNVVATQEALQAAEKCNAKFIYVSTDYVFNNKTENAVDWCHTPDPINYYGFTKWLGEEIVKQYNKSYIVRTSWLYGEHGNNFVKTIQNLLEKGNKFTVVNDQYGRPTNTKDLAKLLVDMAENKKYGIYHATNEGEYTTWFEFAQEIAKDKKDLIKPCTTEEYMVKFPNSVTRPKYSMLSTNNLKANGFILLPDWKESLAKFIG